MLKRLKEKRCGNRIINNIRQTGLVGNLGNSFKIINIVFRISNGLTVHKPGIAIDRLPDIFWIGCIDKLHRDAKLGERVMKQVIRAAIEIIGRDDVVARLGYVQYRIGDGSLTGGNRQSGNAAIEGGKPLFEDICRRIHQPGINIAEFLEAKEVRCMFGALKNIRRSLIQRHRSRKRGWVRSLAGMKGKRLK